MRTLWITGAGGIVGGRLVQTAAAQGHFDRICAFAHTLPEQPAPLATVQWAALDIGDDAAVAAAAQVAPPDVIINPAAMTNVDACERQRDAAMRANCDGPRHLAQVARQHGAHLLHVSTDYVFPGDAASPGPYHEDATPRAINHYGQTKLDGEHAVSATCATQSPYTIVRTALVYGLGARTNFVTWLAKELGEGRRVKIVRDQFNTPTVADDLAAALLWLAANQRTGIYHVAGPDRLGRDAWALAIARHFGLDEGLIDWVATPELGQPAPRPLQSGLHTAKLTADASLGAPRPRGIVQGLTEIDWLSQFQ